MPGRLLYLGYMPSPEGGYRGGEPKEPEEPDKEREGPVYNRVARFEGEKPAAKAYFQAQEIIYSDQESELSAYRLILNAVWHVAVLGDGPSQETEESIEAALSRSGEGASLPGDLLKALNERRLQAIKHGSWVEGHYRSDRKSDR